MPRARGTQCSICTERDAVIFVKVFVNGGYEEKALCAGCAIHFLENQDESRELSFVDQKLVSAITEMRSLISGIINNIQAFTGGHGAKEDESTLSCRYCGYTYERFKETGFLGCPYCYSSFKELMTEFIFEVERGFVHKGRRPRRYHPYLARQEEIRSLHKALKHSLTHEDYEKAGEIKRKLAKLLGKGRREDEIY